MDVFVASSKRMMVARLCQYESKHHSHSSKAECTLDADRELREDFPNFAFPRRFTHQAIPQSLRPGQEINHSPVPEHGTPIARRCKSRDGFIAPLPFPQRTAEAVETQPSQLFL